VSRRSAANSGISLTVVGEFHIVWRVVTLQASLWTNKAWSVVGKLADILEDTQAAKFTDKLYIALEDFQLALQKDKAKKRKVGEKLVIHL